MMGASDIRHIDFLSWETRVVQMSENGHLFTRDTARWNYANRPKIG